MEYEPGTVAIATVRGKRNVRVWRHTPEGIAWISQCEVGGTRIHREDDVTDIRPLVVLDLQDDAYGSPARVVAALRRCPTRDSVSLALADQIEAQTKPPRIPEPGLWGVVEARTSTGGAPRKWTRDGGHSVAQWVAIEATMRREWRHLIDPTLVRPGIEN